MSGWSPASTHTTSTERQSVHGLVHGDYRLDNMLFGQPGADRPLTVVDWQTVTWGPAMIDVAYFLGCALADDVRRDNYDALLGAYHDALGRDAPLSVDDVREGVRRQAFFGVMMAIVSPMLVERTERGDEMFMTMLRRHSQHVLDTDALVTLPDPAAPEPLAPSADDEGAHPPGADPLWSESWYADFVDEGQAVGGWFRLGVMPNEKIAWINALLCGPDIPTVAVNDFRGRAARRSGRREDRCHRADPCGHRALADLSRSVARQRSGVRRPVGAAARGGGATGRGLDGSRMDDCGDAISLPPHAAV